MRSWVTACPTNKAKVLHLFAEEMRATVVFPRRTQSDTLRTTSTMCLPTTSMPLVELRTVLANQRSISMILRFPIRSGVLSLSHAAMTSLHASSQ